MSYAPEGAQVEIMPSLDPETIAQNAQFENKKGKSEKGPKNREGFDR